MTAVSSSYQCCHSRIWLLLNPSSQRHLQQNHLPQHRLDFLVTLAGASRSLSALWLGSFVVVAISDKKATGAPEGSTALGNAIVTVVSGFGPCRLSSLRLLQGTTTVRTRTTPAVSIVLLMFITKECLLQAFLVDFLPLCSCILSTLYLHTLC